MMAKSSGNCGGFATQIVRRSACRRDRLDMENARTEGAIDRDRAAFTHHLGLFFCGKAADDIADIVDIAAATLDQRRAIHGAHLVLLVEQPPQDVAPAQGRIEHLAMAERARKDGNMLPLRMVEPNMQSLAAFLAFG